MSDSISDRRATWEAGYRAGRGDVMDQVVSSLETVMTQYRTPQGQVQVDYDEQEEFVSEVATAIYTALEASA